MFNVEKFLHSDALNPAMEWKGYPKYNFIGGHNDSESIPIKSLKESIEKIILREGKTLSKYGLESGPQGYLPLRKFISKQLNLSAQIVSSENEILVVSGSLQALDLVNETFLRKGDTVIIEEENYGGTISRLKRLGVNMVGIPLEHDGMNVEVLEQTLLDLRKKKITPRYIYTIPTIQNPTGTVMSVKKREILIDLSKQFEIPIFEDDCYADLLFEKERPPAIKSFDTDGYVIYCGSFSKSIAPALRVGYLIADWSILSRILPYKTDAGTGSLEQMALAEFCESHPRIKKTFYPGLNSHPQYQRAGNLFKKYGAIFSVELADELDCFEFLNRMDTVVSSSNLGDNRSLGIPVAHTIFHEMGAERRATMGISDSMVRFSVGLEELEDLLRNFEEALV